MANFDTFDLMLNRIPGVLNKTLGVVVPNTNIGTNRQNASNIVNLLDAISYTTDTSFQSIDDGRQQSLIGVTPVELNDISSLSGHIDEIALPGYLFNLNQASSVDGIFIGYPRNLSKPFYMTINNKTGSAVSIDVTLTFGNFNDPQAVSYSPAYIATDGSYLYVTDSSNNKVMKFTLNGNFVTSWSTFGAGDSYSNPTGIVVNGGSVYVCDSNSSRIVQTDTYGNLQGTWGSNGSGTTNFNFPSGIATDGTSLYVTDSGLDRVIQLPMPLPTPSTPFTAYWGSPGVGTTNLTSPHDLTIAGSNIYISDGNFRIVQIPIPMPSPTTPFTAYWGSHGTGNTNIQYVPGISNDGTYLYLSDYLNYRIVKIPATLPSPATPYTAAFSAGGVVSRYGSVVIGGDLLVASDTSILDLDSTSGLPVSNYNFLVTTPMKVTIPSNGLTTLQYLPDRVDPTGIPGTYALVSCDGLPLQNSYSVTTDVGADDDSFTFPGQPSCIEQIGNGFGIPRILDESTKDYKNRIKLQAFGNKVSPVSILTFLQKVYPTDTTIKVYEGFTMPSVNHGFSDDRKNTSNTDLHTFLSGYPGSYSVQELDSNSVTLTNVPSPLTFINTHKPYYMYVVFTATGQDNRGVFSGGPAIPGYSGYSGYTGTLGSFQNLFKDTSSDPLTATFHSAKQQGHLPPGYASYGGFFDAESLASSNPALRMAFLVNSMKAAGITAVLIQLL